MGETTISPKALEDAMLKALPSLFPNLHGTANGAHTEFYDKFQRTAEEHDRDFVRRHEQDLNTTLIFAGLFSIIASLFIVDFQSGLQPDYTQLSYGLLQIIANVSLGHTPTGPAAVLPQWTGPSPVATNALAILHASLGVSLFAAFLATLGRQWLNHYSKMETRGSIIDRGRCRQRKMNGMATWHFDLVMESLPLLLQTALLLIGYAISEYLFLINKVAASVAVSFSTFCFLFYFLVISVATFSYNCPFQTPLSLIFHCLVRFDDEHKKYLKRAWKWFRDFSSRRAWLRPKSGGLSGFGALSFNDHIELPMANTPNKPPPLFNEDTDWNGYVLDSNCIARLFEMDAAATTAITKFIPEVVWHAGIRTAPLERLYDTVLECFDGSSGRPVVIPKLRDQAYLGAKALLHLAIQRNCVGNESDKAMLECISHRHPTMGSEHYGGDSDLESTLGIIDCVFGVFQPIPWQDFSFTVPHHAWMGHILLYRAWDVIRKGEPLPDDIRGFVLHSLRLEPPPAAIIADCLLIVGLILGIGLHTDDLLVIDKSREVNPQINRIFTKLTEIFRNSASTTDEIDRALEVMELITPLSGDVISQKSYDLFHVIMHTPISLACSEEKKWAASRLAMHSAYSRDKFLPWVEDPQDVLTFLVHHFDSAINGGSQDEPIQDGLRALAYASSPVTIKALKDFDPTNPPFVRGIRHVFQDNKPFQLRKAALSFLPLIGDRWFNTPHPIMESNEMKSFCTDWASAIDNIELTCDVRRAALAVLFGMINSSHWRPHIVAEKWKLLEYFGSVPDDFDPLKRCIDNPDVMDAIRDVKNPDASFLWLAISWQKYGELIPKVQAQLVAVTKEVAQGERRKDLDMYLSTIDSELKRAEEVLIQHDTWSTDPAAVALRTKIGNLQQAKSTLVSLKRV